MGEFLSSSFKNTGICLKDNLKYRFDHVIGMNERVTAPKGESMATFALGGCIGGYIDNPESHTLFHYGVIQSRMIDFTMNGTVTDKTNAVHFFIPEEWVGSKEAGWTRQPKAAYLNDFLKPALQRLKTLGIEPVFHCYSEAQMAGHTYQGTAWVEHDGKVSAEGMPVQSTHNAPEPDSPNTPSQ